MATRSLLAGVFCALIAQTCFAADAYRNEEFDFTTAVYPKPTFNDRLVVTSASIRVVAVLPVDLDAAASAVPEPRAAAERIESQAARLLTDAGYKVITADEMRKIISETRATVGDLYDTRTGNPYRDRIRDSAQLNWETHKLRHTPDAYLMMSLMPRRAEVHGFKASWDGIQENISGRGGLVDFWKGPAQQFAVVPGLSLAVWLITPEKALIYGGIGGLHLLAYIRQSGGFPDYLEVAPSDAVIAETRVTRALELALAPALHGKANPDGKAADDAYRKNWKAGYAREARAAPPVTVSYPQAPALGSVEPGAPPFLSAAQFRVRVKKIALTPVSVPVVPNRLQLQAHFEEIVAHQLEAAGFEVVRSAVFMELFMKEAAANENLFDAYTGRTDTGTAAELRTRVFAIERQQTGCDALLTAAIARTPALFQGTEAHWLGARQIVTGDDTGLAAKLKTGGNKIGTIPASVFRVGLIGAERVVLYEGLGGLELHARLGSSGFSNVPAAELFVNEERNETAVKLAFGDLLGVKPPR